MELNLANIYEFQLGLQLGFRNALAATDAPSMPFAATRTSQNSREKWAIRGGSADMQEWKGQRDVQSRKVYSMLLENKRFEKTESILLSDLEDDNVGLYTDQAVSMGWAAGRWPAVQTYRALREEGETFLAYDGVPFFNAGTRDFDNVSSGSSAPIYFFDTRKVSQAMIWQLRVAPQLQMLTKLDDDHVFKNDELLYGVRSRGVPGFGLPHVAYKHKAATFTASDWESIRKQAGDIRNDKNQGMGVGYNLVVTGPSRRDEVEKVFGMSVVSDGTGAAAGGNVAVNNRFYNAVQTVFVDSDFLP